MAPVIWQPAKPATPELAFTGFVVHERGPPPAGCAAMVRLIAADELTVLPPMSRTMTDGCVAHAAPSTPPPGCWVTESFDATPSETATVPDVAEVSEPLDA